MKQRNIPKIRVLIRKRPISDKELYKNEDDIVSINGSQTVAIHERKLKVDLTPYVEDHIYNFDGAYDHRASNQQIYATSVKELINCAFDGAKVSCFAYGQTGSGKTYTMLGDGKEVKGLYLLAAEDIFAIQGEHFPGMEIFVSFYEIYCGKLYDLLNEKNLLFPRQDAKNNVNIVGLSSLSVVSTEHLMKVIEYGTKIRVTSQNSTNTDSSRSHAVLQITLVNAGKQKGKITFIDLAGSERAADHADQCEKQTRIDGAEINKSLLALKECIRALDQNKNHTPFRGSKLTMVLKDSFSGYCMTVMIGNIAPNSSSCENTLNTLKYADRVKELKKPTTSSSSKAEQFSRELMLARNIKPKDSKQGRENIKRKESLSHQKYHSAGNSKQVSNYLAPKNNFNKKKSSPSRKLSEQPKHNNFMDIPSQQEQPMEIQKYSQNVPYRVNPSIQVIHQLSERHDACINKILQYEEEILGEHDRHINSEIELTKREMLLKDDADKIGNNIEDYINSLDEVLCQKMGSILSLRSKLQNLRGYLQESKSLEQEYTHASEQLGRKRDTEEQDLLFN